MMNGTATSMESLAQLFSPRSSVRRPGGFREDQLRDTRGEWLLGFGSFERWSHFLSKHEITISDFLRSSVGLALMSGVVPLSIDLCPN